MATAFFIACRNLVVTTDNLSELWLDCGGAKRDGHAEGIAGPLDKNIVILYAYTHTMSRDLDTDPLLRQLRLERSGVPIYVQLRDQILQAIRSGVIGPGERLPTMREVAVALKVDLNTVRHAYDELERLGVLTLERGRGTFVSDISSAQSRDIALGQTAEILAAGVLARAREAGVAPAALATALARLIEKEI
jgi:GntR family transcriptional regulator